MVILFIYNIDHLISIRSIYDLFKEYNPRSGVFINKKDKYGKRYRFIKVNEDCKWKKFNGIWIEGYRVYFNAEKEKKE